MGVSGCGKSSLAQCCSRALQRPMVEGDDFHSEGNLAKMRSGTPLTDADREAWLGLLVEQMHQNPQGAVLTCSALRLRYRDRLRKAIPGLRFIYLALSENQAHERVAARSSHLFPASLVASQFDALEDPSHESGVLRLDATQALAVLEAQAIDWVHGAVDRIQR
ncbi:gluconokinase [Hydrogenophaga sp. PAMC20947]|nr:gluconokinase [Hydrogenophaga sp. PAMC20947]